MIELSLGLLRPAVIGTRIRSKKGVPIMPEITLADVR